MPQISLLINADTRKENFSASEMSKGVVSRDFLIDGIKQKQAFLKGFDFETILFIDKHENISEDDLKELYSICDTVTIRKHTHEPNFNDWTYISTLALARGEYIMHFDQDCNAFTSGKGAVEELFNLLDAWKYVSYPSMFAPNAVNDPSFDYRWASTRFFICKRETLNFTEMIQCQNSYEYVSKKYNPSRMCHWLEHILGLISDSSVYYPPIDYDKLAIFSWASYEPWLLRRLNLYSYEEIKKWLSVRQLNFPNDYHA